MSALADWARFPEDDLVRPIARQPRTTFGQEPWLGGSAATLVYVLAGVLIVPRYGEMVDTVARTANAFYVLFSRYPHLGAIGFVWTPLPSLLALPLVALKNVWPGLVRDAVAELFNTVKDPIVIIRWKDIHERLEHAVDALENAADVLEAILVKNR